MQTTPPAPAPTTPTPASPVRTTVADAEARATRALEQLQQDVRAATVQTGVARASWGIAVYSLDRNAPLVDLGGSRLLVPASTAKLVSTASAVDAVGWDHTFATTLRANGPVEGGTLKGDLLVVGTGDPSIDGPAGADLTAWIEALKRLGLTRVAGRVVGDDDTVEEPRPALAWAWDDLGYATGGLFGALNYGENRMAVTITPGATAGAPAAVTVDWHARHRPLINRTVTGITGTPGLFWAEQRPGEVGLTIAGSLPVNSATVRLGVSAGNPTAWFAGILRDRLEEGGILVDGPAVDIDDVEPRPDRAGSTLLYTHRSAPLSAIVRPMLKDSINLYAEAVLRLNAAPGVLPTNDAALDGLSQRLARWGIAQEAIHQIDGSGLSRRNVVAPDALVRVLQVMQDPTGASPFVRALPVAGVDGSLAGRMKGTPAAGNVRAKTGTMSTVRSLAGYATTADGERLAFAIIVNNFEGSGAQAVAAIDAIAVRLATFTRE